ARHAPARPEVDQDDAVLDGLVVVLGGQGERSHDRWNAAAPGIIPPGPRCEPAHPPCRGARRTAAPSGPRLLRGGEDAGAEVLRRRGPGRGVGRELLAAADVLDLSVGALGAGEPDEGDAAPVRVAD